MVGNARRNSLLARGPLEIGSRNSAFGAEQEIVLFGVTYRPLGSGRIAPA